MMTFSLVRYAPMASQEPMHSDVWVGFTEIAVNGNQDCSIKRHSTMQYGLQELER
jgi:hypothetical protein